MKIGAAAEQSGLTVKAIRHYEAAGLLGRVARRGRDRSFAPSDIERLRVIAHCRALGFSLAEIGVVLREVDAARPRCPSPGVMLELVRARLDEVSEQMARLARLRGQLEARVRYLEAREPESA